MSIVTLTARCTAITSTTTTTICSMEQGQPEHTHRGCRKRAWCKSSKTFLRTTRSLPQTAKHLAERNIFAVNLVSSPGAGKTTLLVKTIEALKDKHEVVVIEGDQETSYDADRIRSTGARALQINTGKGCHLDADMVGKAVQRLTPPAGCVLMIENVGNLVCPAGFDLGEAHKVVVLSVTEGEDKPLKYPDMFRRRV